MAPTLPRSAGLLLAWLVGSAACAQDLGSVIQAAQSRDPTLASASANRDAAAEATEIARARLRPQLNLQSTNQHLAQTTTNLRTSVIPPSHFNGRSSNTQITLRQSLLRPRDLIGLEAGEIQAAYGQAKLDSAQGELWLRASQAWLDVLSAQAQWRLYQQAIAPLEQAATQEAKRLTLGDGTRDAAAEASAQLAQARAQLAEVGLDVQTKLAVLRDLSGLPLDGLSDYRLPAPESLPLALPGVTNATYPSAENASTVLEHVLATNPEMQAARLNEALARKRLDQAQADHYPTLDVIGSAATAKSDSTNTLGSRYLNHQIGFQLAVPLYAGGGISASARQSLATLNAASADLDALAQRVRAQFQTDWNSQLALRGRLQAARELVRAAQESRKAAELGLKAGIRTWGDISNAQMLYTRRSADELAITTALLKTQTRLLSLLPSNDPAWADWTATASRLAQPPAR